MLMSTANFNLLNDNGLNMQAVFNLPELPEEIGVVTLSYTFFDKQKATN